MPRHPLASLFVALAFLSSAALTDAAFMARGALDKTFCDDNGDLTADLATNVAAAPVASGVFLRMVNRGQIRQEEFRVIWRSQKFPNTALANAHDLDPTLRGKLTRCFFEYRFPGGMQKPLEGTTQMVPVSYKRDWEVIRKVVQGSGESVGAPVFLLHSRRSNRSPSEIP